MNDPTTPPRILMTIPYAEPSEDLNLGHAYETTMRSTTSPWILLMDYDAMILSPRFYAVLLDAIEDTTHNWGILTTMASRTGSRIQSVRGMDRNNHDVISWRRYQEKILRDLHRHPLITLVPHGTPISGHVILLRREAWEKISPIPAGLLGVDWTIAQDIQAAGYEIGLIESLVVYHFYRGDGNKDHLKRANEKYINPYP